MEKPKERGIVPSERGTCNTEGEKVADKVGKRHHPPLFDENKLRN